jgi:hypothetical protein
MYGTCREFREEGRFTYIMNVTLSKFGDNVYHSPAFSNIIYQVGDSCLTAKYHIKIAGGMPPLNNDITDKTFKELSDRYPFFNGDILEMKDFTWIKLFNPETISSQMLYSHASKQVYYLKEGSINPLYVFFTSANYHALYEENTVVVSVNPYVIATNWMQLYKNEKYFPIMNRLVEGVNVDDNPILFFYKLKDNI